MHGIEVSPHHGRREGRDEQVETQHGLAPAADEQRPLHVAAAAAGKGEGAQSAEEGQPSDARAWRGLTRYSRTRKRSALRSGCRADSRAPQAKWRGNTFPCAPRCHRSARSGEPCSRCAASMPHTGSSILVGGRSARCVAASVPQTVSSTLVGDMSARWGGCKASAPHAVFSSAI